jgi:hypothetical protein
MFTTLRFPSFVQSGDAGPDVGHGFLYSNGAFSTIDLLGQYGLDGINDAGQIVGYSGLLNPNGVVTPLQIPGVSGPKLNINNAGVIAGSYVDATGMGRGFLYADGVLMPIDAPGAQPPYGTEITGINNQNDAVGNA